MKVVINTVPGGFEFSAQAVKWLEDNKVLPFDPNGWLSDDDRAHPLIVEVVELMGAGATEYGSLKVVEVDDNQLWFIWLDDNGVEYVEHRLIDKWPTEEEEQ